MRRLVSAAVALALVAGCHEPTAVPTGPAAVSWIEWPTAVKAGEPGGVLRVSGSADCPYVPVFDISVRSTVVTVTVVGRYRGSGICLQGGASGAGFDTLLPLPALAAQGSVPFAYLIRVPMGEVGYSGSGVITERSVGFIALQPAPDTTTKVAGRVLLRGDSLGCWLAQPASAWPQPQFAFTKPVPLTATGTSWRSGFVSGRLVTVNPPICVQVLAIDAEELVVDATPH